MNISEREMQCAFAKASIKMPPNPCPGMSMASPERFPDGTSMPTDFPNCIVQNLRWMGSEADILAMNTYSGCVVEFEIKVDREDLKRECKIAYAAEVEDLSILNKDNRPKFAKHRKLHRGGLSHPPHYYSFLVPEEFVGQAIGDGPSYAGVLAATLGSNGSSWDFSWAKDPELLCSEPISDGFMRVVAAHLYSSSRELFFKQQAIEGEWTNHKGNMLKRVAEAVRAAEELIAEIPHPDSTKRKALYERAVSGMILRDKQHVWRIYEKLYIQSQMDLF